jgi:protein-tyrosine kinase
VGIVERAANRLGAVPKPDQKPSADGDGNSADASNKRGSTAEPREPDLIERAIGTGSPQAHAVSGEDPMVSGKRLAAGAQTVPKAAVAARRNRQTLEIDLKWLRQQNIITPDAERTPIAECFRHIKRHILANVVNPVVKPKAGSVVNPKAGAVVNLVMVTSALPGEGKTFCAINLAISMAMELGRRVLLVDADMARPNVLPALGLKPGLPGLMDVLGDRSIDVADVLHRTNIEKLTILPAGTAHRHATEILASETMRTLVRELAERYDDRIVIFDSPPLLVASEAAVLATHMSQIVVVVAAGQTTEAALKDALRRLEGCGLVGLLLNKGQAAGSGYYGYDGYG